MKKAVITLWFLLMQLCVGSRKAAYKKADFFHQHKLFKKFGGGGGATGILAVFHLIQS